MIQIMKVQIVTQNGALRWATHYWVYITTALKRGKYVGLKTYGKMEILGRVYYKKRIF